VNSPPPGPVENGAAGCALAAPPAGSQQFGKLAAAGAAGCLCLAGPGSKMRVNSPGWSATKPGGAAGASFSFAAGTASNICVKLPVRQPAAPYFRRMAPAVELWAAAEQELPARNCGTHRNRRRWRSIASGT